MRYENTNVIIILIGVYLIYCNHKNNIKMRQEEDAKMRQENDTKMRQENDTKMRQEKIQKHQSDFDKDKNINETKYKCFVERERNKKVCFNKPFLFDTDGNLIETIYKCVVEEDKCYEDKSYDDFERNKRFNDKCYEEREKNKKFNEKYIEEYKRVRLYCIVKHERLFDNGNINRKYKCVVEEDNNYKEYNTLGFRRFVFTKHTTLPKYGFF